MMTKKILARIWATWGILMFLASMLLMYLPFLFCLLYQEPKRTKISYLLFRNWMRMFLPLVGVRIKVDGLEYFEKHENYIVVCNHRSFMDIPVSTTRIPGPNKTIAKIEMARVPIFGQLYKLGSVLVDRKNKKSRLLSFMEMKKVVEMGLHMVIYPEGQRNKSGSDLLNFHDGAFQLAVDTQKKIIPAVIKGTAKIMPPDEIFYFLPGKINLQFLPAQPPGSDTQTLKLHTYQVMSDRLSS